MNYTQTKYSCFERRVDGSCDLNILEPRVRRVDSGDLTSKTDQRTLDLIQLTL